MHKAHHVYKKDMGFPWVQSKRKRDEKGKKKVLRLSLHHHEYKSASPCKQQADPAQTA